MDNNLEKNKKSADSVVTSKNDEANSDEIWEIIDKEDDGILLLLHFHQ